MIRMKLRRRQKLIPLVHTGALFWEKNTFESARIFTWANVKKLLHVKKLSWEDEFKIILANVEIASF